MQPCSLHLPNIAIWIKPNLDEIVVIFRICICTVYRYRLYILYTRDQHLPLAAAWTLRDGVEPLIIHSALAWEIQVYIYIYR